jgi:hypothetical protein
MTVRSSPVTASSTLRRETIGARIAMPFSPLRTHRPSSSVGRLKCDEQDVAERVAVELALDVEVAEPFV